ncbi:hypothetical protein AMTR_s00127p00106120 [Amborella trichopoda]|uniref:Uncharacterized protein n=1 Tax=Amborella trichopoda TaxID=13333 RepID=W1NRP4_AMBTC|nr:hypothetical protein AMTR_s00127p00106120 [Amborella trichopoda]
MVKIERLHKLVHVHYNLDLRKRQVRREVKDYDPINLDYILNKIQQKMSAGARRTNKWALEEQVLDELDDVEVEGANRLLKKKHNQRKLRMAKMVGPLLKRRSW